MSALKGVEILGPLTPAYKKILTPEALAFVAKLVRKHGPRREALLEYRKERQALIDGAPVTTMGGHLLPLAVMAVVFIPLGVFVFGRAERYAKRTGKLKRVG